MSDYAGPILGTVGAVIGGTIAPGIGAQWGWAIGSAIGGMYSQSQQVIPGPKIGDVQRQTQQEGGFRPIVYGRSHPIAGNVIADGGPVIVTRRESQGKGGPKVETESAYRTYAVGFCEGEATLLQAWRNGILVYDAEDPSMSAENAKFLEYATWYTGSFDQPASPDLEEIYGVGQAPYFRGTAYLSLHNEDVTDQRGAWSQWQVRVFRGAARSYTTMPYPIYAEDNVQSASGVATGVLWEGPLDHIMSSSDFIEGSLREPLITFTQPPEDFIIGSSEFVEGELRTALITHVQPPEDFIAGSSDLVSGTLRVGLVTYNNYPPEGIETSSDFISGTLT